MKKLLHDKISDSIIKNIDQSDENLDELKEVSKFSIREIIKSGSRFHSELNTILVPNLLNKISDIIKNDN